MEDKSILKESFYSCSGGMYKELLKMFSDHEHKILNNIKESSKQVLYIKLNKSLHSSEVKEIHEYIYNALKDKFTVITSSIDIDNDAVNKEETIIIDKISIFR